MIREQIYPGAQAALLPPGGRQDAVRDGRAVGALGESEGQEVQTCTIITIDANSLVGELHDRMPAIIAPGDYDDWLDAGSPRAQELLKPFPSELMSCYAVSTHVNNVRNDDVECMAPIKV